MFSLNFLKSMTKTFVITVKGLKATSCVRDQDLPQHQQDTCERQDILIELNSCFSDFSYSLNSLNSIYASL